MLVPRLALLLRNMCPVAAVSVLVACVPLTPAPPATPVPSVQIATPPAQVDARQAQIDAQRDLARIDSLLAQAQRAYLAGQLTTPLDDNAYFKYLQVLSIDAGNEAALAGLNDIVEKYLEWALVEVREGSLRVATDYLNAARSIDETHPSIAALEQQISDRRQATLMRYPVPTKELMSRSEHLAQQLSDIGRSAVSRKATVTIVARSDAEGRWIYQQLNSAVDERVRARVELGSTPEVRLLY